MNNEGVQNVLDVGLEGAGDALVEGDPQLGGGQVNREAGQVDGPQDQAEVFHDVEEDGPAEIEEQRQLAALQEQVRQQQQLLQELQAAPAAAAAAPAVVAPAGALAEQEMVQQQLLQLQQQQDLQQRLLQQPQQLPPLPRLQQIPAAAAAAPAAVAPAGAQVDVHVLAQLLQQLNPPRHRPTPKFKVPEYDGTSDVDAFTDTFLGIMGASGWLPDEALLHLRSCLRGAAKDTARGTNLVSALESLRQRFGLTATQARDRLAALRYDGRQSLHELGAEVERLVSKAYDFIPADNRPSMSVEIFKRALNNPRLQQHLLLSTANTVGEVVRAAEAFLQVNKPATAAPFPRPQVAAVDSVDPPVSHVAHVEMAGSTVELAATLNKLMKVVEENSKAIGRLSQVQPRQAPGGFAGARTGQQSGVRTPGPCWLCNGPHLKNQCPSNKDKPAGNATRPQS